MALAKLGAALRNLAVMEREQNTHFGDAQRSKGGVGVGIAAQAFNGLLRDVLQLGLGGGRVEFFLGLGFEQSGGGWRACSPARGYAGNDG